MTDKVTDKKAEAAALDAVETVTLEIDGKKVTVP